MLDQHSRRWVVPALVGAGVSGLTLFGCANTGGGRGTGEEGGGGQGIVTGGNGGNAGLLAIDDASVVEEDGRVFRAKRCDDAGNCTCINIASYGQFGTFGQNQNDSVTKWVEWLSTQSGQHVDTIGATPGQPKVPLTPELLNNYDVLIIQDTESGVKGQPQSEEWSFTPDEIQAVQDWVNAGGGLITLQGYSATNTEMNGVNQLLQFSGIQYISPGIDIFGADDGTNYCHGGSEAVSQWVTGSPIADALTFHVRGVGAFHGWAINPGDATVFLNAQDGVHVGGAAKNVGAGAVVVYNDEWITYTSQWSDSSVQNCNCATDVNNPCCKNQTCPEEMYQTAQFWYDMINFAAAATQCPFEIKGTDQYIK
jgi:hypothetical protein